MVLSQSGAWQCHQSQLEPEFAPFPVEGGLGDRSDAPQRLPLLVPGERSVVVPILGDPTGPLAAASVLGATQPGASPDPCVITFPH